MKFECCIMYDVKLHTGDKASARRTPPPHTHIDIHWWDSVIRLSSLVALL